MKVTILYRDSQGNCIQKKNCSEDPVEEGKTVLNKKVNIAIKVKVTERDRHKGLRELTVISVVRVSVDKENIEVNRN